VGVQERSYAQIAGFREMVDVCGLYDLGYEGRSWTFEKRVAGGSYCQVRLDRALATPEWNSRCCGSSFDSSCFGPLANPHEMATGQAPQGKGKKDV